MRILLFTVTFVYIVVLIIIALVVHNNALSQYKTHRGVQCSMAIRPWMVFLNRGGHIYSLTNR